MAIFEKFDYIDIEPALVGTKAFKKMTRKILVVDGGWLAVSWFKNRAVCSLLSAHTKTDSSYLALHWL